MRNIVWCLKIHDSINISFSEINWLLIILSVTHVLFAGDLGQVDREGYFTITDRLKELIKYKGFQVN